MSLIGDIRTMLGAPEQINDIYSMMQIIDTNTTTITYLLKIIDKTTPIKYHDKQNESPSFTDIQNELYNTACQLLATNLQLCAKLRRRLKKATQTQNQLHHRVVNHSAHIIVKHPSPDRVTCASCPTDSSSESLEESPDLLDALSSFSIAERNQEILTDE
jgi:hypothetical protein